MYSNFNELQNSLSTGAPKTLAVAAAHDPHTLEAVFEAAKVLPMKYILVGDRAKIADISKGLGITLKDEEIVDAADSADCELKAIELIRSGSASVLMKGIIETGTLLKAVLDRECGIRGTGTMSHLAMLDVPAYKKLIAITDGGMIPHPTLTQKADIIRNAVGFCQNLGIDTPKVAVLCASESVSEKMPETEDAAALEKMCKNGELGDCLVEGPVSFDIAVDMESASIKKYPGKITGEADIFLVPTVATGNIFAKSLQYWGGAKMAGCVLGAKVPIVLTSRGASADEKLFSIMLCLKASL